MKLMTKLRKEKGWSKSALSRFAELNAVTVGLVEAGKLTPYQVQIQKIAKALNYQGAAEDLLKEI